MDKIQDRFSPIFQQTFLTQWLKFWILNQAKTKLSSYCFHKMTSLVTQNDKFGHSKWQPRVSKSLNFIERFPHCPILFSLALVTLKSFPPSSLAVLNWVKWFWHLACHSEGAICVLLRGFFMIFQFLRAFHSSNLKRAHGNPNQRVVHTQHKFFQHSFDCSKGWIGKTKSFFKLLKLGISCKQGSRHSSHKAPMDLSRSSPWAFKELTLRNF